MRAGRSDLELVREILRRDRGAGPRLTKKLACVPRFLASRNAQMGAPLPDSELEDVVQDVLVVIWSKLERYRGHVPLEVWVYRICSLELLNAVRRRRSGWRERAVSDRVLEEEAGASSGDGSEFERRERLYAALDRLPEDERELVRLKHFEDLSFTEIGERLGLSANTAKTRYYRGVKRLTGLLEAERGERP